MSDGLIVKAISGFYYVEDAGQIRQCRARGVFKKKGIHPLVGDCVTYTPIGTSEGVVESVKPRSSELIRPPVANMDHVLLAFSVREPDFSLHLLDRLLLETTRAQLHATIVLTKIDLGESAALEEVIEPYRKLGYPVIFTSSVRGIGIDPLRDALMGRKTVIAGQSGVGKSSLLNLLVPDVELKSAEISQRLGRGRHTTRHVELLKLADDSYVADTPGFSQLDFKQMRPEELQQGFLEIRQLAKQCQYRGCLHEQEEGCAVLPAVGTVIAKGRYKHYREFLDEVRTEYNRRF